MFSFANIEKIRQNKKNYGIIYFRLVAKKIDSHAFVFRHSEGGLPTVRV